MALAFEKPSRSPTMYEDGPFMNMPMHADDMGWCRMQRQNPICHAAAVEGIRACVVVHQIMKVMNSKCMPLLTTEAISLSLLRLQESSKILCAMLVQQRTVRPVHRCMHVMNSTACDW